MSWRATLLELGRLRMGPDYPGATGAFAEPVDVPATAGVHARLAAFLGRSAP